MITTPTVFILGAGASNPYNFPTGKGLLIRVLENLQATERVEQIALATSASVELITKFRDDLRHSGMYSVDAFLERRREFLDIGKAAIAQALIPFEDDSALFSPDRASHWYQYIYNQLSTTLEEFTGNKVSLITFNYDRSLEYYFHTAISRTYNLTLEKGADLMKSIPIIHLHGQLGFLDWQKVGGDRSDIRTYASTIDHNSLTVSVKGIKIIFEEGIEQDPEFERAHDLLNSAELICFLGFGYAPTNIRRLKPEQWAGKQVFGTTVNLTDKQVESIRKLFPHAVNLDTFRYDQILSYLTNVIDLN